ncbi:MAG TPA: CopG family ribbon-helix-helix protein [Nitrosopumilaceae archaeon]|nr:CopG family ribbon-helix-helix protein [Nitrosopumilaceae archaeon]
MPIVSISLNAEILTELDNLQKSMGFSGRSEAIRAAIRSFVSDQKQKSDLSGNIHAILLVVHNDEFDHVVSGITHNFEDLITTHLHSKIEKEKCMELFVIDGSAEKISTITKDFQTNKNMDTVKLVAL